MDDLIKHFGVLGLAVKTSIRIDRLALPPQSTQAALSRYARHIIVHTGVDQFPYQLLGSGTAVVVDGRYFVFSCVHQTAKSDIEMVSVMSPASEHTISGRSFHRVIPDEQNADGDIRDVQAMQFVPDDYNAPNLASYFFPVELSTIWPNNSLGKFVLFGYPSSMQGVDYDIPHISSVKVTITADYVEPSSSPYLHAIRMDKSEDFDPDGLSGGPVFYLGGDRGDYFFGLAGMVMRGSDKSDILWFIEAAFLYQVAVGSKST